MSIQHRCYWPVLLLSLPAVLWLVWSGRAKTNPDPGGWRARAIRYQAALTHIVDITATEMHTHGSTPYTAEVMETSQHALGGPNGGGG